MVVFTYAVTGLLGLLVGSFLNVCIFRIPNGESVAFPPSHCTSCGHRLGFWDLFPVFSFLFLKGKCRYCGDRISIQYPLVEALNSVLYVLLLSRFGMTLAFLFSAVLISALIILTFIDIYHMILPDKIVIFGLVIGVLYVLLVKKEYIDSLWGALAGGGFFLLIALITRGNMGGGDIKLMAMLGIWLGLGGIAMTTVLAFVTGSVASLAIVAAKKGGRKTMVPFGPFICLGAAASLMYYTPILSFYLRVAGFRQ
ncbi:MAG: prepilin peptidase [Clostridia bacterium]|nr:prepilin peptidase [Clostridia bacterium]